MNTEKDNKKVSKKNTKTFELYTITVILITFFLSIAYAQISDEKLEIGGNTIAVPQQGVFISDITKASSTGLVSQTIKYYKSTNLSTQVQLSSTSTSNIIYTISLYNNSSQDYYFSGVVYDESAYDNKNIEYVLDGLEEYKTTIGARETLKFNLKFKYKDGITVSGNQTLNSMLKFNFSNEMINFKIANTSYTAPSGATWEQFINSEYNTYGLKITSGKVYTSAGKQLYNDLEEVLSTDKIISGKTYNYKPELTLDQTTMEVEIESGSTSSKTLTATLTNITGDLTWTSSNTDVAEVVGNGNTGTVTLKKAGTVEITVAYKTLTAKCTITVTEKAGLITFTIDGTTYYAEDGMTWGEWVELEYNTGNYYVDTSYLNYIRRDTYPSGFYVVNGYGHYELRDSLIKGGAEYRRSQVIVNNGSSND